MKNIVVDIHDFERLGIRDKWFELRKMKKTYRPYNRHLSMISKYYGLTTEQVLGGNRHKNKIKVKRLYAVLCLKILKGIDYPSKTSEEVAVDLNLKSHASVLNHVKKFNELCQTYESYRNEVLDLCIKNYKGPTLKKIANYVESLPIKFNHIRDVRLVQSTGREFIKMK